MNSLHVHIRHWQDKTNNIRKYGVVHSGHLAPGVHTFLVPYDKIVFTGSDVMAKNDNIEQEVPEPEVMFNACV